MVTSSHTASASLVCESCHTGILVFQQTGAVRRPDARVYRCNCCGSQVFRDPPHRTDEKRVAKCDCCNERPGVRTVIAAGGTETWACEECIG